MSDVIELDASAPVIDVTTVANQYRLTRGAVLAAIRASRLPARKIGNTWAVSPNHAAILWEHRLFRAKNQKSA